MKNRETNEQKTEPLKIKQHKIKRNPNHNHNHKHDDDDDDNDVGDSDGDDDHDSFIYQCLKQMIQIKHNMA